MRSLQSLGRSALSRINAPRPPLSRMNAPVTRMSRTAVVGRILEASLGRNAAQNAPEALLGRQFTPGMPQALPPEAMMKLLKEALETITHLEKRLTKVEKGYKFMKSVEKTIIEQNEIHLKFIRDGYYKIHQNFSGMLENNLSYQTFTKINILISVIGGVVTIMDLNVNYNLRMKELGQFQANMIEKIKTNIEKIKTLTAEIVIIVDSFETEELLNSTGLYAIGGKNKTRRRRGVRRRKSRR